RARCERDQPSARAADRHTRPLPVPDLPGRMTRMRRSLASVLTIMSLCALSACASPPEPTMTLDESKQQLVEILTAGADAAGGEWDDKFDRATEPCVDRYGREGQRYALNSFGPGTGEARRVVE